jgi:hypothetical protein
MAFQFGGIPENTAKKHLKADIVDILVENHFQVGEDYYIFLLDQKPDIQRLNLLKNYIEKTGFKSYMILLATALSFGVEKNESGSEDSKDARGGLVAFYISNESNWKQYITYKGIHCKAIMAFGAALYAINKSADFNFYDFTDDDIIKPYYYLGNKYLGDFDTFIFPAASLNLMFQYSNKSNTLANVCWITRFNKAQMERMATLEYEFPDDMRDIKKVCATENNVLEILNNLMNSNLLAVDIETTSLNFKKGKIHSVQFSNDGETGYFILWKLIENLKLKRKISFVLKSAARITGSNLKFDFLFLWENGIPQNCIYSDDTQLLAHSIHSERPKGLKPLTFFYQKFGGYDFKLEQYKKQMKIVNYSKIPSNILQEYSVIDPCMSWRNQISLDKHVDWIDKKFPNEKLPQWTIRKFYENIMIPIAQLITKIEYRGFVANKEKMDENREILKKLLLEKKKAMAKAWGVSIDFNFNSKQQLGTLFQKLGWQPAFAANRGGISKDGTYSTKDACLTEWKDQGKPGIDDLIEYRTISVFIDTFLGKGTYDEDDSGWAPLMCFDEKEKLYKIFHKYIVCGTNTYRHKAVAPNMQQIGAHSPLAKYVASCISVPKLRYIITDKERKFAFMPNELVKIKRGLVLPKDLSETDEIVIDDETEKHRIL